MFKTIKNAFKTPDVRKRVLYTLLLVVIFRLGCYITVPGVNSVALRDAMGNSNNGMAGLIDIISGGAFSRFSLFAMSITPYITSSIVIQLLGMIIPSLEKLTKEGGEEGRKKINKYTKMLTILLATVEAIGLYFQYKSTGIFINTNFINGAMVVIALITGTSILMWLGDEITSKGIGNGISFIIFVGIVSGLPSFVRMLWGIIMTDSGFSNTGLLMSLGILIGAILLVAAVVFIQQAERRVPVQYSKKVVGRKMVGAQNTHIPLKLAMAGVMPIIFASSFLTFPAIIIQLLNPEATTHVATGIWSWLYKFSIATSSSTVGIGYSIGNALFYLLLIMGFTFFYTYATFNPAEVSSNIKKNGGFIPGIRAGKPTTEYLSSIISKLTWVGGFFLAVIAILPMLLRFTNLNISFGGTSILIVVGVALETVQQLESFLVMRHYKGFLE